MAGEGNTIPLYHYSCTACAAIGTAVRTIAERNRCPTCTQCGKATEKILTPTMVSVFTPYTTVAHDKETGRVVQIRDQAEHRSFLARNGYEEVGNDKSMAPLSEEEHAHRRAEKLKDQGSPVFDFDETTHHAQL